MGGKEKTMGRTTMRVEMDHADEKQWHRGETVVRGRWREGEIRYRNIG